MLSTKGHFQSMRLCLLLASVIWATVASPLRAAAQDTFEPSGNTEWTTTISNPNPNNFDTPFIINAIQHPHSDLVLLSAHRGIHALAGLSQAEGVAENSLKSVGLAAQAGWEMLELDVKLTSDGVPILSHDKTWGREWCGQGFFSSGPYNPFIPPGTSGNDASNSVVSGTSYSGTRSILFSTVLRDTVSITSDSAQGCGGFVAFYKDYPPTLSQALDYIAQNKIRMVLMLDIQGLDIAKASLNAVLEKVDDANRPFLNSVIFKMPMSVFPNGTQDFANTFGANSTKINFIPVINTADIAPKTTTITDTEDGGFDVTDVGNQGMGGESGILTMLQHFEADAISAGGVTGNIKVLAVEVGYKEPNGILTTVLQNARKNLETQLPMTVGEFNPVGEFYPNGDTSKTPQFFRSSNGTCCDVLDKYLYNNPSGQGPIDPSQPIDKSDQRTNLSFLLGQGFQYLITDDPTTASNALKQQNKRNLCYLQPSCEAGTAPAQSAGTDPNEHAGTAPNCPSPSCQAQQGSAILLTNANTPPSNISSGAVPAQRIAYYTNWSVYGNGFFLKNLDTQGIAANLTTLNYAFENIDPVNLTCMETIHASGTNPNSPTNYDGAADAYSDYQMGFTADNSVDGSTDQWGQPLEGNFNQLRELKAKYPHLKILMTLGGWTFSKFFSDVAATDASRKKFVSSCINLFIKGNLPVLPSSPAGGQGVASGIFDGFDIDWEYPASPDGNVGNHFGPQDTANYTALLAEFRSELNALGGEHLLLTAALPSGPKEIKLIQVPQVAQLLDFGDVMTYDMHGSWETTGPTNFQAPIFDTPFSPAFGSGLTVNDAINNYIGNGFPAKQLTLGVPFYGRGWTGVPDGGTHGLYQTVTGATDPFPFSQEAGVVDYKELESAGKLNDIYIDLNAISTWVYDGSNFFSIETPYSLAYKRQYIQKMGLGGIMMYSLEDDDPNSTLFKAAAGVQ